MRQALNMAVDRPAILKNLYSGRGQFLNTVTGQNVANTIDPGAYPYDPARAKALLAEAGFGQGFEIDALAVDRAVDARRGDRAGHRGLLGQDRRQDQAAGARVGGVQQALGRLRPQGRFYYAFINGTWDVSYTVQRFKPDFPTFRYFDASGDLLKTIQEYERTFDPKKRKELAAKALKGLHDEAVWVFLWQLDELIGVSKKVKGFKMRPDNVIWVRDTYVEA